MATLTVYNREGTEVIYTYTFDSFPRVIISYEMQLTKGLYDRSFPGSALLVLDLTDYGGGVSNTIGGTPVEDGATVFNNTEYVILYATDAPKQTYKLTWYDESGRPEPGKSVPIVEVNGHTVTQPYTLQDGDVITVMIDHCVVNINGTSYTGSSSIELSDTSIYAYGDVFVPTSLDITITINYSEGGGGTSMLDVTYNSQKIIDSLEVTPPVTVTYNGSTIATLNEGDTKTLQCNGKVMASDIVIGNKTLQCNGKYMEDDIIISCGNSGTAPIVGTGKVGSMIIL